MFRLINFLFLWLLTPIAFAQGYIPAKAYGLKPLVISEVERNFPTLTHKAYIPALIEHESCISLSHSRCWSSTSQLKSQREHGIGLGMITKAYKADGSIRFDSLNDLRSRYRKELADAHWDTIKSRADIQIRMIVLMTRDNYLRLYDIIDPFERLSMSDAAYNGGLGGLQRERRQCSLTKGCDASKWFGHVEKVCLKSKKILYANRSACDINRHHVKDVLVTRMLKYDRAGFMN